MSPLIVEHLAAARVDHLHRAGARHRRLRSSRPRPSAIRQAIARGALAVARVAAPDVLAREAHRCLPAAGSPVVSVPSRR